jgi:arginyl-tRNA--protein-N-Asp/Glu arginylyltransferase
MFNINSQDTISNIYNKGLLPQRNKKNVYYQESSSRSNLSKFNLSSENKRILNKTNEFTFKKVPIYFDINIQKSIFSWLKKLEWNFPISSVKTIFTNHIFNYLYTWYDNNNKIIAYSVCYFDDTISHIAYVFYDPAYNHSNLPIRLVLQTIIDSKEQNLQYCYLGRFSKDIGYYKRNMPGFEYYENDNWRTL